MDSSNGEKIEIAKNLTEEQGKPLREALGEMDGSILFLTYAAKSPRRIEEDIVTSEMKHEEIWIKRVAYGVTVSLLISILRPI